jgi:hypothetical protein
VVATAPTLNRSTRRFSPEAMISIKVCAIAIAISSSGATLLR